MLYVYKIVCQYECNLVRTVHVASPVLQSSQVITTGHRTAALVESLHN